MRVGTIVVFLAGSDHVHNGSREHPAVVTRVWGEGPTPLVNLKVLPDCGEPFDATSVHHWTAEGWPPNGQFVHCYREA
jgi:hypothetical protein